MASRTFDLINVVEYTSLDQIIFYDVQQWAEGERSEDYDRECDFLHRSGWNYTGIMSRRPYTNDFCRVNIGKDDLKLSIWPAEGWRESPGLIGLYLSVTLPGSSPSLTQAIDPQTGLGSPYIFQAIDQLMKFCDPQGALALRLEVTILVKNKKVDQGLGPKNFTESTLFKRLSDPEFSEKFADFNLVSKWNGVFYRRVLHEGQTHHFFFEPLS